MSERPVAGVVGPDAELKPFEVQALAARGRDWAAGDPPARVVDEDVNVARPPDDAEGS